MLCHIMLYTYPDRVVHSTNTSARTTDVTEHRADEPIKWPCLCPHWMGFLGLQMCKDDQLVYKGFLFLTGWASWAFKCVKMINEYTRGSYQWDLRRRGNVTTHVAKTKALIIFAVTAKLSVSLISPRQIVGFPMRRLIYLFVLDDS